MDIWSLINIAREIFYPLIEKEWKVFRTCNLLFGDLQLNQLDYPCRLNGYYWWVKYLDFWNWIQIASHRVRYKMINLKTITRHVNWSNKAKLNYYIISRETEIQKFPLSFDQELVWLQHSLSLHIVDEDNMMVLEGFSQWIVEQ